MFLNEIGLFVLSGLAIFIVLSYIVKHFIRVKSKKA